jgi:PAS domain S-box-containing protein
LAVPVRRGDKVVGAIDLESSSPSAFTQDDLKFVLRVADQIALAMEGTLLQERAQTERERLSLLMEAVDNAVWVVDADLRLLAQNEAASHMLGWPSEDAIGRSLYEFTPSHNPSTAGVCHLLSQVMEQQQPLAFPQTGDHGTSLLVETKDGRPVLIKGRAIPLVQDGHVEGAICAFREVPTEKTDEHVRFEFTNMASHLLRSPLSFIQASIDLMSNSELHLDEQRVILAKMREQSQRMRDFIRDLLEMSRLETGSISIYPEPVALPPLVKRVLALVQPEEPHYVVNFNNPQPFPVVAADPAKMELVLLSLLRSAMNRCPTGGCIGVELEANASEVVVSITDNGEIIPPKQLDRVFSQFYPVDDDGDKMPSTYILGLYSTRRLVELQNGRVWAESAPDTGTRFGFSLPVWGCVDDSQSLIDR